jgi:hypothetical protein
MRSRTVLLGLVALALCGAACGGSNGNGVASQSPDQAVQTALAAFRSAKSVTVSGDIGTGTTSTTNTIDGVIFDNGDFDGTIGVNGTSAKLIKIDATDYLEGAETFWQGNGASGATAAELADKWIEIPDSQMGLGNQLSIPTLASQFTNHGTLSAGTTGTVEGQAAVSIVSSKGGTLWIATTGTAYPLELETAKQGAIFFSNYDASTAPTAPAGAVPVSSLGSVTGTTGTGTTGTATTVPDNTGATGTGGTGNTGGTTVTTSPGTTGSGSSVTTVPGATGATGTGTDTTST